jgi:hypothetical protein
MLTGCTVGWATTITEEKITAMAQSSFCKRMGIEFIDIIVINNSIRK